MPRAVRAAPHDSPSTARHGNAIDAKPKPPASDWANTSERSSPHERAGPATLHRRLTPNAMVPTRFLRIAIGDDDRAELKAGARRSNLTLTAHISQLVTHAR
ncbi:MAG: hypothetical protein R2710_30565 [Acidimicrobiales bacterium]